jgi:hypothetical protein
MGRSAKAGKWGVGLWLAALLLALAMGLTAVHAQEEEVRVNEQQLGLGLRHLAELVFDRPEDFTVSGVVFLPGRDACSDPQGLLGMWRVRSRCSFHGRTVEVTP